MARWNKQAVLFEHCDGFLRGLTVLLILNLGVNSLVAQNLSETQTSPGADDKITAEPRSDEEYHPAPVVTKKTPELWEDEGDTTGHYADHETSIFKPRRGQTKHLNLWWPPLVSVVLPGFDQWWEGQYGYASAYTAIWLGGGLYAADQMEEYKIAHNGSDAMSDNKEGFSQKDDYIRKIMYGNQLTLFSGGLSAYHSFRTAVNSRRDQSGFDFLRPEKEESINDLLLAPFHFQYLGRLSTIIPLGIAATLLALNSSQTPGPTDDYVRSAFKEDDAFFAAGTAYNAGVSEEALFRGYVMPMGQYYMGREWASNTVAAGIFALAHLSTVQVPVVQFALGWHLGHVAQKNAWTLGESIFIHTWWDVLVLAAQYQFEKKRDNQATSVLNRTPHRYWLPTLEFHF